ncbi:MAG: hypothetical protein KBD25_05565 [Rickettsiaceae bacterium]|nr:hypothetical protein [Rickettsiaceae bacterium]
MISRRDVIKCGIGATLFAYIPKYNKEIYLLETTKTKHIVCETEDGRIRTPSKAVLVRFEGSKETLYCHVQHYKNGIEEHVQKLINLCPNQYMTIISTQHGYGLLCSPKKVCGAKLV